MKKLLAILLMVILIASTMGAASFAKDEKTAAYLSRLSTIKSIGLPASDVYKKSGNYTMKLSGKDIYKNIKIPCISDWSDYNAMEMWIYSPNDLKPSITLALISDNKSTPQLDYYVATIMINTTGWNLVSLPYVGEYSEFTAVNNPKGMDSIDTMEIWTQYDGEVPDSALTLYFDKVTLKTIDLTQFDSPEEEELPVNDEKGVDAFAPFTLGTGNANAGSPLVTDWRPYNTLVLEMTSESVSMRDWWMIIKSDNPKTGGADYYHTDLTANWVGDKTWVIDLRGGLTLSGSPLGMKEITGLEFWTYNNINNDTTSIKVNRMYLLNKDWSQIFKEENGNYLIDAVLEKDFVDYVSIMESRHNGENAHPRMFFDKERLGQMREWIKTDNYMKKSYAKLIQTCEDKVKSGAIKKASSDASLPMVALGYLLSGDERYKEWVWESIKALTINCTGWNPNLSSYLTVGDTMRYVSYVYDWMYNEWTEEQRRIVRNAIIHYGSEPTLNYTRAYNKFAGSDGGNWGQIIMSGLGASGLAIAGDAPEQKDLVNEIINRSIIALTKMHSKTISPEGDYVEGVGYWSYGMANYLPWLAAMQTSLGTTGGLADLPGMRQCGNFPIGSTGPKGFYNFADSAGGGVITAGGFFFLSDYFDDPSYGAFQLNYTSGGGDWYSMLLYNPRPEYDDHLKYMPKYTYTPGNNEVVTIRKSWVDNNASFLGVKAGSNTTWHDHLDVGSFIYDNLGVRWAIELGRDDYDHLDLYDDGKYAFYRNRAEGQNALVINPDGKIDQNTGAQYHCPIDMVEVNETAGFVTMDVSKIYEGRGASSVKRGFVMLNNFGSLLIRDEIKTSKPSEVYSFLHTQANIEVAPDGKSAVLTQGGQKLRVRLIGDSDGKLLNMAADPLPTSPSPAEAYPRNGIRKLAVHVKDVKSPVINMLLTPYFEDANYEFSLDSVLPMRQWKTYLKDSVQIDNIYIDGVPIPSFMGDVSSYVVNEYQVGEVSCDAPGLDITIKQAEKLGDTAFIIAKSSKNKAVYTVSFAKNIQEMMEVSSYKPVKIWADLENSSAHRIMDNNLSRDWSVSEPATIFFDFGEPKLLKELKADWYKGSERVAYFTISVSDDGENWKEVYDGESFLTDDFETYSFAPVTARYMKLYGKGNSSNKYVSINEVRITAYEDAYTDIANHWAKEDIQHLSNVGILTGQGGAFNPEGTISRAEFVDLVQKVQGYGKLSYSGKIKDIAQDAWYMGSIEGALEAGIIPEQMIDGGNFSPDKPITCEEMLAIAARACNYDKGNESFYASIDGFANRDGISDWYVKDVQSAVALRLPGGSLAENGGIIPTANATRAQAAVIAKRVYIKTY